MILNAEQQEVVDHNIGPLLVLACPGSGKTRCIIERICKLLDDGLGTNSLLGVTFTNKAANEMKERLEKRGYKDVLLCTFHSLGVRILRKCGHLIGYKKNFTIIDQSTQHSLLRKIVKENGLDPKESQFDPKRLIKFIEDKKNQLISDEKFELHLDDNLIKIFRSYNDTLKASNAMDFGDLILNVVKLFEKHPQLQEAYSKRFLHILVDEMQDTNKAQLEMVKRLSFYNNNIVAVADERQVIYSWRSACIDNIVYFDTHFPGSKTIALKKSYRCTPEVLDIAQKLINHNNCRDTKLEAVKDSGPKVDLCHHLSPEEEAEEIANLIKTHQYHGIDYREMAILCRTNAQTRVFEECFRRRNIPYELIGAYGFYDRKEVKIAISFMKFLANPEDIMSFEGIINMPSRGVGPATLIRLLEHAKKNDISFREACYKIADVKKINKKAKTAISNFIAIMDNYDAKNPCESLSAILEDCGYLEFLRITDKTKGEHREDNVEELLRAFKHYCSRKVQPSLSQYLQEVMLLSSSDKEVESNAVSLMTCHAAKGLEFEVVFVPGLEEEVFPHKRSIAEGNIEEERRVCYVAITRSKEHLHLSYCAARHAIGSMPSRFLENMGLIEIDWDGI